MNQLERSPPAAAPQYFILGLWAPAGPSGGAKAPPATAGNVDRFLRDWTCRCLPIPLCSASSDRAFKAYRLWCSLQGITRAAPMNDFVSQATVMGFVKGRHIVRQLGSSKASQQTVLHPPEAGVVKSGRQLDEATTAFSLALDGWRAAATISPAVPKKDGK